LIEPRCYQHGYSALGGPLVRRCSPEEEAMKVWTKPAVREQEVGLEVTSYLPAEIDII
jgi:coenzyme PQQ precursor peptide PqqA